MGNIRSDSTSKYGFDCDPRCHYIISQEDYDSYREKHEAFVSLMRIALLQDYFCLIDFLAMIQIFQLDLLGKRHSRSKSAQWKLIEQ